MAAACACPLSPRDRSVPFLILAFRRVLASAPFVAVMRPRSALLPSPHWCELAADFYPTVKAALRHESADPEEDQLKGCQRAHVLALHFNRVVSKRNMAAAPLDTQHHWAIVLSIWWCLCAIGSEQCQAEDACVPLDQSNVNLKMPVCHWIRAMSIWRFLYAIGSEQCQSEDACMPLDQSAVIAAWLLHACIWSAHQRH